MSLEILNEIHPLIAEAWSMGFDPILDQGAVVVLDLLPTSGEDVEQRAQSKSDLEKQIKGKEEEVRIYLHSLDNLQVMIDSKILGERIWIVGRKERLSGIPPQEVGYLPQEVIQIKKANWTNETLKKMHQIKKVFGGNILDIQRKRID